MLRCVSVVIADRHEVVLYGLKSILAAERDFSVVATCRDAKTCMEIVRNQSPDLALVDPFVLSNSGGQELLSASKAEHWRTRLVFFSSGGPGMETAIARGRLRRHSQEGATRAAASLVAEGRVGAKGVATCNLGY